MGIDYHVCVDCQRITADCDDDYARSYEIDGDHIRLCTDCFDARDDLIHDINYEDGKFGGLILSVNGQLQYHAYFARELFEKLCQSTAEDDQVGCVMIVGKRECNKYTYNSDGDDDDSDADAENDTRVNEKVIAKDIGQQEQKLKQKTQLEKLWEKGLENCRFIVEPTTQDQFLHEWIDVLHSVSKYIFKHKDDHYIRNESAFYTLLTPATVADGRRRCLKHTIQTINNVELTIASAFSKELQFVDIVLDVMVRVIQRMNGVHVDTGSESKEEKRDNCDPRVALATAAMPLILEYLDETFRDLSTSDTLAFRSLRRQLGRPKRELDDLVTNDFKNGGDDEHVTKRLKSH